MTALAMWFQDASTGSGFSADSQKWIVIFLGMIAFSMLVQALVYIIGGLVALKAMKEAMGAIGEVRKDLKTSTDEIKAKVYPLVDGVLHMGKTAQTLLDDTVPKVKTATAHLVETSRIVRDSAEKLAATVGEVNLKTQRQVARVDGMVTGALNTTAEIAATVEHGIKVPAQKIASAAIQVRYVAEGLLGQLKGLAEGLPFMRKSRGTTGFVARPVRPPVPQNATTPASATGPVPLVK